MMNQITCIIAYIFGFGLQFFWSNVIILLLLWALKLQTLRLLNIIVRVL